MPSFQRDLGTPSRSLIGEEGGLDLASTVRDFEKQSAFFLALKLLNRRHRRQKRRYFSHLEITRWTLTIMPKIQQLQ